MNGLVVADRLPHESYRLGAHEHEADELHEEYHLARKVVQGLSAAYLLSRLGARSLTDELEATLARIATWVAELDGSVRDRAPRNVLARRMLPVIADLDRAQREILRFVSSSSPAGDRDPLVLVRRANDRLERVFALTPLGSTPTSNGCALEITHLAAARSN